MGRGQYNPAGQVEFLGLNHSSIILGQGKFFEGHFWRKDNVSTGLTPDHLLSTLLWWSPFLRGGIGFHHSAIWTASRRRRRHKRQLVQPPHLRHWHIQLGSGLRHCYRLHTQKNSDHHGLVLNFDSSRLCKRPPVSSTTNMSAIMRMSKRVLDLFLSTSKSASEENPLGRQ